MAVRVPDERVDAKLSVQSMAPTEQSAMAVTTRRLRRPDCKVGFFFMVSWYIIRIGRAAASDAFSGKKFLLNDSRLSWTMRLKHETGRM